MGWHGKSGVVADPSGLRAGLCGLNANTEHGCCLGQMSAAKERLEENKGTARSALIIWP